MTCTWREDLFGNWMTSCGQYFLYSVRHAAGCPFCGINVEEIAFDSEGEESE